MDHHGIMQNVGVRDNYSILGQSQEELLHLDHQGSLVMGMRIVALRNSAINNVPFASALPDLPRASP